MKTLGRLLCLGIHIHAQGGGKDGAGREREMEGCGGVDIRPPCTLPSPSHSPVFGARARDVKAKSFRETRGIAEMS